MYDPAGVCKQHSEKEAMRRTILRVLDQGLESSFCCWVAGQLPAQEEWLLTDRWHGDNKLSGTRENVWAFVVCVFLENCFSHAPLENKHKTSA